MSKEASRAPEDTYLPTYLPVDRVWNGGSDLQAGVEIYHWGHPGFWLILSSQIVPLLGPQFHLPTCGQLAAPYPHAHKKPGPLRYRS